MSDEILYEKLISEKEGDYQIKLVVSVFRDTTYLSLRKYFLSFDEGYVPSREGLTMPYEIASSYKLLQGILELIPLGECRGMLMDKIDGKFD